MPKYSKDHMWVKEEEGRARVGISDFAQRELGEIAFIELPNEGSCVEAGNPVCSIDSLKSTSDVYAPISGKIVKINSLLTEQNNTSFINKEPLGQGWLFIIEIENQEQIDSLLTEEEYEKYISE